jgi:hypothetical protein
MPTRFPTPTSVNTHSATHQKQCQINGLAVCGCGERVCQRADKTPLWATVSEAYDPAKEHIQVRHHAVELTLRALK